MLLDYPKSEDLGEYLLFVNWYWPFANQNSSSENTFLALSVEPFLRAQRGQCLSDLVGFLMGHHIEDAFMFLTPVLLLLESHGAGFLKSGFKICVRAGAGTWKCRRETGEVVEEQAGENTTLMHRLNGRSCWGGEEVSRKSSEGEHLG